MLSALRGSGGLVVRIAIIVILPACQDRPGLGSPDGADSADTWHLAAAPSLMLGGLDVRAAEVFANVRGVTRTTDGSIAVADVSTNDIRVFSARGEHIGTVGGPGDGPGEFREIWGVFAGPGDTIWGFDQPRFALAGFHGGTFQRVLPLPLPFWPIGLSGGNAVGSVVATRESPLPRKIGIHRDPSYIIVVSADRSQHDTVANALTDELYLNDRSIWDVPILQRRSYAAAAHGLIVLADGGSTGVSIIGLAGDTLSHFELRDIRGEEYDELVAANRAHRLESVEQERRAAREASLNSIPLPEQYSDIADMRVDVGGRIWIRRVQPPNDAVAEWRVHHSSGDLLARINIPVELRIWDIGETDLVATTRGEFDVPLVVVYRIEK